jgi:hypothetical protein
MSKEIKEWKVESVPVDDVIPMPDNERFIEQRNMEGLKHSLRRFGLVELPIYNKRTKHLIGGHQRFYSMKEMGAEIIDMLVVDMDEEEELAANLTMNNPEIQGDFTAGTVDLLNELELKDKDMFQSLNMDVLKKEVEKLVPKVPTLPNADLPLPNPDFDSVCPCCGHKWTVGMKDISVENIPEIDGDKDKKDE